MTMNGNIKRGPKALVSALLLGTAVSASNSFAIDEIIVTAQRKSESLQNTPIAVTAVTAEMTQALGLSKVSDIASVTPGANFTVSAGFFSPNIRGLGVAFTAAGLESPVAVYEDGAYLTNTITANELLQNYDLASIQVLRGPQGTLYGRNASGGVILITSADPTDKLEGKIRGEYGNFEHEQLDAVINVPLAEDLALRVSGGLKNDGGYIKNVTTNSKNGWEDNEHVRAKLRWSPGSADIVLGTEYYDLTNTLTRTATLGLRDESSLGFALAPPGLIDPTLGFYKQQHQSFAPPVNTKYFGANLKMDFDLDSYLLTSTTTYRDQSTRHNAGDSDNTPLPLFEYVGEDVGNETISQDLQLLSSLDGPFNFLAGLSYLHDQRHFRSAFLGVFTGAFDVSTPIGFVNVGTTDSYAGYLEGYFNITDQLQVTVGGRYTVDKRQFEGSGFGVPWGVTPNTSQEAFTPRFVLAWDNGPTNIYYSFTKGFKAGGFQESTLVPPVGTIKPEKISSHEIGIKQSLLDDRLRLNAAVFYYKNKGLQVQTIEDITVGGARTANANLENYGIEVEAQIFPTDRLTLGITAAWQHPEYKPFDGASGLACYVPGTPGLIACGPGDPVINLTGTAPPQAPTRSASLSANYEFAIGSWSASLSGLATYRSEILYQPGAGGNLGYDQSDSLFLANASGYVSPPGENLRIGFYVNNVFDKEYVTRRQSLVTFGTGYNAGLPRTYGLRVEYMFE